MLKTAATMLATPVRSRDVDEMVREREATLAAFRARVAAGEASGGAAESTPVKDADDDVEEEEASSSADEATDEEQAETPTPEVVNEVKPKRGGRAASTRGTRGVKTSGIPRAPLVDKKNAQDA